MTDRIPITGVDCRADLSQSKATADDSQNRRQRKDAENKSASDTGSSSPTHTSDPTTGVGTQVDLEA